MIISHKHKFIFIKTRKIAGTSLEIALSPYLGPDDIITRLGANEEALRKQSSGLTARNHRKPFYSYTPLDYLRVAYRMLKFRRYAGLDDFLRRALPADYLEHMPAYAVRDKIGHEIWDNYHKFSIERNPYDFAVSLYCYLYPERELSFHEFVHQGQAYSLNNYDRYTINGMVAVDTLLDYEQLYDQLPGLLESLQLPREIGDTFGTTRAKGNHRGRDGYRAFYDTPTRRTIDIQFARERELMGYGF